MQGRKENVEWERKHNKSKQEKENIRKAKTEK